MRCFSHLLAQPTELYFVGTAPRSGGQKAVVVRLSGTGLLFLPEVIDPSAHPYLANSLPHSVLMICLTLLLPIVRYQKRSWYALEAT
ncbi:hypothetical protein E3J38_05155 [candidate division TA06 bacterium]|uniref:Uncharacterized protein n=1 Tax=candidate division TA06 bacterium TaxID=2250710 RepID=A0A523XN24_UNCT6|nr:MAG: hypothetical protein E3J38_05155 [candidate division TA06 bacterium]